MWQKIWSRKKILFGVLGIIIIAGWFIIGRGNKKDEYVEYTVGQSDLTATIELSGKVTASKYATIRFPTGGLVTYLGAQKGDTVKKYQTLASVDSRQIQKILEQKLNLYAIQRGTFEQTRDDYKKNLDDGDVDQELRRIIEKNQYQLDNVVKDVEYQDFSLKLSRLTSPLAGMLVSSPITVSGVNVLATDTWTVVDPTSLEFVAELDEADLPTVHEGHDAIITFDAYPDLKVNTKIRTVAYAPKELSSGTTYEVKMSLPEDVIKTLRLGLNGTAEVLLDTTKNALTLSPQAVTYKGTEVEVLIKENGKYVTKKIELGTETATLLQVKNGLSAGDKVYVKKTK